MPTGSALLEAETGVRERTGQQRGHLCDEGRRFSQDKVEGTWSRLRVLARRTGSKREGEMDIQ